MEIIVAIGVMFKKVMDLKTKVVHAMESMVRVPMQAVWIKAASDYGNPSHW